MQRLEVSGAVRPIYGSLGVKRLIVCCQTPATNMWYFLPKIFRNPLLNWTEFGVSLSSPYICYKDARWEWIVNATSRSPLPPGLIRCPLYRRLCGPQGRSGRLGKISPPPGLGPRIVIFLDLALLSHKVGKWLGYTTTELSPEVWSWFM